MASSRKRPPKPDPADSALLSALQRAVGQAQPEPAGLLIAYSGGPDSTALLDLAGRLRDAKTPGFAQIHAAHVHHGLQPEADAWAQHCLAECARRGVPCTVGRVSVAAGRGVEDGARSARYAALLAAALDAGAGAVLTAHHADDRIETFLLQWLRGAGPAGLAGIAAQRGLDFSPGLPANDPSGAAPVQVLRPLLSVARRELEQYLERHGLKAVEDPSNADPRYARNALRLHVLPALVRIRSGFVKSAARSIELVGEAAEVLEELAQEGLASCTDGAPAGMLRLDRLAALAPVRRALVLRAWLAQLGVEAPSRARLGEALDQALGSGRDGRMLIRIGRRELRRHGGLLYLRSPGAAARTREVLHWSGEPELAVATWGGVLRFMPAEGAGFDPVWLRERPLELRVRTGGERLKPHMSRPSKRLKRLYQEAGVPEFERAALPLLWRDDRLIFVARLGADARLLESGPGRVRIEWQGETLLLPE
jgi:tRNA(Ile)-lysidine synthase